MFTFYYFRSIIYEKESIYDDKIFIPEISSSNFMVCFRYFALFHKTLMMRHGNNSITPG